MAKFNREFLVPYLRDVCAVELQINRLIKQRDNIKSQICGIEYREAEEEPILKQAKIGQGWIKAFLGVWIGFTIVMIIPACFAAFVYSNRSGAIAYLIVPLIFAFPVGLISWLYSLRRKNKRNQQYQMEYQQALFTYEQAMRKEAIVVNSLPNLRQRLNGCTVEIHKAQQLRNKLYSANVIPVQYRNIYASVYLYQFFSTSQADDIDMTLQTFVLEEIKARLDKVIQLQTETIINQEIMIANQRASMEAQQQYQSYMKAKAKEIAGSIDEQNAYLSMIEGNTAATAYFAAARAIRNM